MKKIRRFAEYELLPVTGIAITGGYQTTKKTPFFCKKERVLFKKRTRSFQKNAIFLMEEKPSIKFFVLL
jgi:hypothetical protein